ncbi:MAG: SDR family oxidoreductase [Rhodobacteraceae bacterium]|nr:SDR family oxidoreductase [Paracoccaceae bacterium]
MRKTILVFGHGYSAAALSPLLLNEGWRVIGTTRGQERLADIRAGGVEAHVWPGDNIKALLPEVSHILLSIAPDADGDPVLSRLGPEIAALAGQLVWLGYLSTTAVYGDHQGGWVDETTPLVPSTRRGAWRVAAEAGWQQLAHNAGLPLHIFRLAGIYGPGRGPFAKLQAGTARRIIKSGQVFSRIHVDDIAATLMASIRQGGKGGIYNVCDDLAAPPEDVIGYAAELLGLPVPVAEPFDQAGMSAMARSFYAESKRVRNDRIKNQLGVVLNHPTYVEGLRALQKRVLDA